MGEFDPFGFATDADLNTMKKYREAESTHGRVAMLAFIGLLITEQPFEFHAFFEILVTIIGAAEFGRALSGWRGPETEEETGKLGPFFYVKNTTPVMSDSIRWDSSRRTKRNSSPCRRRNCSTAVSPCSLSRE